MNTQEDAYIPESWKNSCLGKDYQRVANEYRDAGMDIIWKNDRPYLTPGIPAEYLFMYPTRIETINFDEVMKRHEQNKNNR